MIKKTIMPTMNILNSKTSASLLVKDDTPDASNWTSEFVGRWEDDRTAEEIIEDIRGARISNKEIEL